MDRRPSPRNRHRRVLLSRSLQGPENEWPSVWSRSLSIWHLGLFFPPSLAAGSGRPLVSGLPSASVLRGRRTSIVVVSCFRVWTDHIGSSLLLSADTAVCMCGRERVCESFTSQLARSCAVDSCFGQETLLRGPSSDVPCPHAHVTMSVVDWSPSSRWGEVCP